MEDGYEWLERSLGSVLRASQRLSRERYEIPSHPVGEGRPFSVSNPLAFEVARDWFGNADWALRSVIEGETGASEVRIWPHHFDAGALVVLDRDADPATARSIGLGMTPGDDSYPDPYFYVNPYPNPPADALPTWTGPGRWHTEGWIGLVLTTEDIVGSGDGEWQQALVLGFLEGAVERLKEHLAS